MIETLVDAAPDAIQLSVGQAAAAAVAPRPRQARARAARRRRQRLRRAAAAAAAFSHVIDDAIGHAVRLDAACVVRQPASTSPGADALRRECIENVTALRTAADRAGMPLMVEPLVMTAATRRLRRRRRHRAHRARSSARRSSSAPTSSRPTRPTT